MKSRPLLLYFCLIGWMFGQIACGLIALLLSLFSGKRTTISASGYYDD